jgi:hypothetical protein
MIARNMIRKHAVTQLVQAGERATVDTINTCRKLEVLCDDKTALYVSVIVINHFKCLKGTALSTILRISCELAHRILGSLHTQFRPLAGVN